MNILIDTHIFLWLANGNIDKVGPQIDYLYDINNNIFISSISIAEIMIKKSLNKLKFDGDIIKVIKDMNIKILDFDGNSAVKLSSLPFHHRDPFDRMIISQSLTYKYKIISVDKKFKYYECEIL
jgi:PIN domain nuclease of toxin-antitoxin system